MVENVDGQIYVWEKPEKSDKTHPTLGDSLIAKLPIADINLFLNPKPELDPYYPYIAESAKEFFAGKPGKLLISGDYDVDGTTASAILGRAFRLLGWDVRAFIPDRFTDNYGVNYSRMEEIYKEWAYDRFIAADCGATELVGLAAFGKEKGVTMTVLDHHKRGAIPDDGVDTTVIRRRRGGSTDVDAPRAADDCARHCRLLEDER